MSYIYAVSDIHARWDLLKEMVEANIDFSDSNTMLVCCGDYVDGVSGTNSYECLMYLYQLYLKYPQQVVVLQGNHDAWFLNWLCDGAKLEINQAPQLSLVQDFMDENEFYGIYIEGKRKAKNNLEWARYIYKKCKESILKNHKELIHWLNSLPYYYESNDHQIFVHAGIFESKEDPELWKIYSSVDDFLMKSTIERSYFYKDVIAGHTSTSYIVKDHHFKDICCYGIGFFRQRK